jgi:hypothetical protein
MLSHCVREGALPAGEAVLRLSACPNGSSLVDRKYQGILGGVVAFANSIGPVLGGVLTEKASCMSIQAVVLMIFANRIAPNPREMVFRKHSLPHLP